MASIVRAVVSAGIAASLVLASRADALVFCARKKKPNVVTTRGSECRKNEISVPLPIAGGPQGPQGAPGAQGVPGPPGQGLFVIPLTRGDVTGFAMTEDAARAQATPVALFQKGVLSIYGKCYRNTNGDIINAAMYIATSQDGGIFEAANASLPDALRGGPALATHFLTVTTTEANRELAHESAFPNDADSLGARFFALGPDGTQLTGSVFVGLKQGTAPAGPFGGGDGCLWGGHVVSP